MTIQTKTTQHTPKQLFFVFMRHYLERRWGVVLIFIILIIINVIGIQQGNIDYMPLSFILIILGLVVYVNIQKFFGRKNKHKYITQSFLIEEDKINIQATQNSKTIPFSNFLAVFEKRESFLLFYNKNEFLFLPKNIFKSDADIELFRKRLFGAQE